MMNGLVAQTDSPRRASFPFVSIGLWIALGVLGLAAFGAVFAAQDLAALDPDASAKSPDPAPACFTRKALSPLSQQAQSLTLAPLDAGAPILLHTAQRVLAAPYHRNVAGNKEAVEIFLADPALAQTRLKLSGVRFLAICPFADDANALAAMAPMGLAARLLRNVPIDWLAPLHETGAPLKIFEVR